MFKNLSKKSFSESYIKPCVIFCLVLSNCLITAPISATPNIASEGAAGADKVEQYQFKLSNWHKVDESFSWGQQFLGNKNGIFSAEILLFKISLNKYSIRALLSQSQGTKRTGLDRLLHQSKALAGINANFFDEDGNPLGLVIDQGTIKNQLHKGGSILNGIFHIRDNIPQIETREGYILKNAPISNVQLAVQAGPILIENGKAIKQKNSDRFERRAGVATTTNNEIIFFASTSRFPGISFPELQDFLLAPDLKIKSALNFDGGSSSQIFISRSLTKDKELWYSGGENIPVGLAVFDKAIEAVK